MKINRFVVHELIKNVKKNKGDADTEPELVLSKHLASSDASSELLIEEIHKSFSSNSALKHTHFEDRNDKVFKKSLEKYLTDINDDLFFKFSEDSLKELKVEISKEPFATGGYYIFADYTIDSKQYISVILLRKRPGLNLIFKDNGYVVSTTENLNVDKIAMGFRLNVGIYESAEDDRSYIALITNQQDKLSGYFREWVVAAGVISDEKNTSGFVKILKGIEIPQDEEGNDKYNRETFLRVCYDFVNGHPEKKVNLRNLSKYLYGEDNETQLIDYAASNQIIIDNEFKRNSGALNRLITIKAKVEGIELNVNYGKLNENEVDVHEEEEYIIIRSKELVEQIISQRNGSTNSR
jgi:nucleoid-associated protein